MTLGGRFVSAFPAAHLLLVATSILCLITTRDPFWIAAVLLCIYFLPLLIYRVHNIFWPLKEGLYDISAPKYNSWWASYQFQYLFISFPMLEVPIHFIPGGFSTWLRLWGSTIGKNVTWTPRVEIVDRGLLVVGSHVVVGHIAAFCSHMIVPRKKRYVLLVKKIKLGDGAFIGADSQFGPGAEAHPGEIIKPKAALYWQGDLA